MAATRRPATVTTEFYPGTSEELAGDPHKVVIEVDGLKWPIYFYTPDQLCACLATEVTCGRMPQYVATAAVEDVRQWLFDCELAPRQEPEQEPQRAEGSRTRTWMSLAGFLRWVMAWLTRGER